MSEQPSDAPDTGRGTPLPDGGETFCIACGEAFDPDLVECPFCGHAPGADSDADAGSDSTGASTSGSASRSTSESASRSGPRINDGGTSEQSVDRSVLEGDNDGSSGRVSRDSTGDSSSRSAPTESPSAASRGSGANETYCPECGEIVDRNTTTCPYCGATVSGKSPVLAGILSFFITGAGQVYNGDVLRGIAFFFGIGLMWILAVVTAGLGGLLVFGVWAWAVYDAYTGAKSKSSI